MPQAGEARCRDGEFFAYSSKDGLPNPTIYQILEDDQAHLWISQDVGIARIARRQLDDYARGAGPQLHPRVYDRSDGLRSHELMGGSQPAGWKSRDGELWFATSRGLVSIDHDLELDPRPPAVVIERVVADGVAVSDEPAGRA